MSNTIRDGILFNQHGHPVCPAECPTHPTDKQVAAYQAHAKKSLATYKASLEPKKEPNNV